MLKHKFIVDFFYVIIVHETLCAFHRLIAVNVDIAGTVVLSVIWTFLCMLVKFVDL